MSENTSPQLLKEVADFSLYLSDLPVSEAFYCLVAITSSFFMVVKDVSNYEGMIKDYCKILEEHALSLLEHKDEINKAAELMNKMTRGQSDNEPEFNEKT